MPHDDNERSQRIPRLVAVVAGIAGLLLCALVPLLPVKQTTATILWPQGTSADGHVTQVTAPLVSGAPRALDISIPCSAIATLPASGGLVVSTLPTGGVDAGKNGLFVRADKDVVVVAFRDIGGRGGAALGRRRRRLQRAAHLGRRRRRGRGLRRHPGASGTLAAEKKPQVGGIFTDLKVPAQPGLSARIDIDTRFITAPTALKKLAMVAGRAGGPGRHHRAGRAGPAQPRRRRWSTGAPRSPGSPGTARGCSRVTWRRVGAATWLADAG